MQEGTMTDNPYQCPACGAALPTGSGRTSCPKCHGKLSPESVKMQIDQLAGATEREGSATACVILGLAGLGIGLYFLINPSVSGYSNIANMHALAVGQALTVAGAVLLGLGIRPR